MPLGLLDEATIRIAHYQVRGSSVNQVPIHCQVDGSLMVISMDHSIAASQRYRIIITDDCQVLILTIRPPITPPM